MALRKYSIVKLTKGKYGFYDERKGTMFFATFFTNANWLPCTKINATVTVNVIIGSRKNQWESIVLYQLYWNGWRWDKALKEKGEKRKKYGICS